MSQGKVVEGDGEEAIEEHEPGVALSSDFEGEVVVGRASIQSQIPLRTDSKNAIFALF